MSLKSEIKKAITLHSKKYIANKVWKIEAEEDMFGRVTLWIEVSASKKKKPKRK